jgi:hypothetical protein
MASSTLPTSSYNEREFWMLIRQALLMVVDAIERRLEISPRTSELKRQLKNKSKDV